MCGPAHDGSCKCHWTRSQTRLHKVDGMPSEQMAPASPRGACGCQSVSASWVASGVRHRRLVQGASTSMAALDARCCAATKPACVPGPVSAAGQLFGMYIQAPAAWRQRPAHGSACYAPQCSTAGIPSPHYTDLPRRMHPPGTAAAGAPAAIANQWPHVEETSWQM